MKKEKLILDYATWRCGDEGIYKLGEGKTLLKNEEGFCCCLGQWSLQLGATDAEIFIKHEPSDITSLIPLFAYETTESEYGRIVERYKTTTEFAHECMLINDEVTTTPDEKINQLTEILFKEGIILEVINRPAAEREAVEV